MLKLHRLFIIEALLGVCLLADASELYSRNECQGSAMPYDSPACIEAYPDSLTPVMINHVGRHGARYAASDAHAMKIAKALDEAARCHTITATGRRLRALIDRVDTLTGDRWGRLDSLGMVEQQGIARRMYDAYPMLFDGTVNAVSSYVGRCRMSMYEFVHELALCNPKLQISTASGPQQTPLLRFFQDNSAYESAVSTPEIKRVIAGFQKQVVPMSALRRVVGSDFPMPSDSIEIAMAEYSFIAGLSAIGLDENIESYLTEDEFNSLWQSFNFKQYMVRTATVWSEVPAAISAPLLMDLIASIDDYIADPQHGSPVVLRFGHAETLMPLLSLMQLPGCYYLTDRPETVAGNWQDFYVVPMASNLQMKLFQGRSGQYYVRFDLNERPVEFIAGSGEVYIPWPRARALLLARFGPEQYN